MSGKIFKDSSSIYQDQAQILLDYFEQAAEKIVKDEKLEDVLKRMADSKKSAEGDKAADKKAGK